MVTSAVCVFLDDGILALSRVLGLVRRRNVRVTSLAMTPSRNPEVARLVATLATDPSTAEALVKQLCKTSGVRDACVLPDADGSRRELVRVRVRAQGTRGAVLDAASLYRAAIVDETAESITLELAGEGSFVVSFLRALEPHGILEIARTGVAVLDPALLDHHIVPPSEDVA
ncbi:MAG: acetolactate synthase small subunit [Gemmatimonadota bacterium]